MLPQRISARQAAQVKPAAPPSKPQKAARPKAKPAADPVESSEERTAGRVLYDTLELRRMIYTLLDRRTLLSMMTLEKDGIESVAEVVYETVHISNLKKFTRKSARKAIYCGAVRTLDICPLTDMKRIKGWTLTEPVVPPAIPFEPQALLENISIWKGTFPRLRTILNDINLGEEDDRYVARLRDGHVFVDLHSMVRIPVWATVFPPNGPTLPPIPIHEGMTIHHTVGILTALRLEGHWHGNYDPAFLSRNLWTNYFLKNPGLDRRVTECDYADVSDVPGDHDRLLAVIKQRKDDGCEPWAKLHLPLPSNGTPMSFDLFRQVVTSLGSGLRVLSIIAPNLREPSDLRTVMSILDSALPQHRELSITLYLECWPERPLPSNLDLLNSTNFEHFIVRPIPGSEVALSYLLPPLPGLTNLRKLHLDFVPHEQDPRIVARYFAPLGAESCVYLYHELKSKPFMQACNAMIRQAKFPPYPKSRPSRGGKPNILEALGDDYHLAF